MKIEKALEKAKRLRLQADEAAAGQAKSSHEKESWAPPVYCDTRSLDVNAEAGRKNRCVCLQHDAPELDYYKVLRTQLIQRTKPKNWNVIMITSVRPGEGKTLTSINLALTFAKAHDQTVLLVDCDLRQQKVFRYLGIGSHKGIVDYLANGHAFKDIIIWPKIDKLTLVSGSRPVRESAELLGSPRMRELVAEMKQRYADRYVLIDVPPILSGADALTLAPLVDGIVMVVESGKTPIKEIDEAVALIPKEKFLGFVLNKHTSQNRGYYAY
jgi:non-specific protein-tyrosine kinase